MPSSDKDNRKRYNKRSWRERILRAMATFKPGEGSREDLYAALRRQPQPLPPKFRNIVRKELIRMRRHGEVLPVENRPEWFRRSSVDPVAHLETLRETCEASFSVSAAQVQSELDPFHGMYWNHLYELQVKQLDRQHPELEVATVRQATETLWPDYQLGVAVAFHVGAKRRGSESDVAEFFMWVSVWAPDGALSASKAIPARIKDLAKSDAKYELTGEVIALSWRCQEPELPRVPRVKRKRVKVPKVPKVPKVKKP